MSKVASALDIDHITSVIQRRCGDMGVTLEWCPYAITASTGFDLSGNMKVKLPPIHSPVTQAAMDKLYGFVIHECGHHTRPECFDILKSLPQSTPPALHALFNIAEDDGMERDVAHAYLGDCIALGKQNEIILSEITKEWAKHEHEEGLTKQEVAPMSVCALAQLSRLEWDAHSNSARSAFFNGMIPIAKELVEELASEGWVDKLQATVTPHNTWDLACDLYKRLFPDADEEELEELRKQGHSGEPAPEPEQSEGEGEPTEGEGEGQGEGDGLKEGEGGEAQGGEGTIVSWKDAVLSEHNEWKGKEEGAPAGNIGIDWTDYQRGEVCLMPQHEINVMDMKDKKYKVAGHEHWSKCGEPSSFMADNSSSRAFANQIRRYIQSQERTRVTRDKYHGKLDKGAIVKLVLPPIDGGDYNKRLFYDFESKPALNTAIHVLTDWSGSMQGDKMIQAADASGRLVHVFDRVLRMPVQLAAFTNSQSECDIGLIKRFNERSISPEKIAERFSKFYPFSSANNDADAVMWAYRELQKRREPRKILIVLSDGCPAGAWQGSSYSNLLHVTKHIDQAGDVELYGVGICSDAVSTYYPNHKVLNSPEEINSTLFEIIKAGAKRK